MTRAASPIMAHMTRLAAQKTARAQRNPNGNYTPSQFQYGVVAAVHAGPPATVDVYLDGTQNTPGSSSLTTGLKYDAGYVPHVDDVVYVQRGSGANRSSRIVMGKVNGATTPYPTALGGQNSSGLNVQQIVNAWANATSPPPANLGANGDWCNTGDGHVYYKTGGSWVQKV